MADYMDFLPDGATPSVPDTNSGTEGDDHVEPTVHIMPVRHSKETWHAVFAYDPENDGHTEFTGTRSQTVEWARARCGNIYIWSPDKQDIEPLDG